MGKARIWAEMGLCNGLKLYKETYDLICPPNSESAHHHRRLRRAPREVAQHPLLSRKLGARKIAACEHPTLVKEEVLKHAAEEFRHAHYLKRQIEKVSPHPMSTYSLSLMLGGTATLHYLTALDLRTARYLKERGFSKGKIREMAYLLVTYAIELRAEELYPIYDEVLRKAHSRIAVKSILLEEKEHLEEMREGLETLPSGFVHAKEVCALETELCNMARRA